MAPVIVDPCSSLQSQLAISPLLLIMVLLRCPLCSSRKSDSFLPFRFPVILVLSAQDALSRMAYVHFQVAAELSPPQRGFPDYLV